MRSMRKKRRTDDDMVDPLGATNSKRLVFPSYRSLVLNPWVDDIHIHINIQRAPKKVAWSSYLQTR